MAIALKVNSKLKTNVSVRQDTSNWALLTSCEFEKRQHGIADAMGGLHNSISAATMRARARRPSSLPGRYTIKRRGQVRHEPLQARRVERGRQIPRGTSAWIATIRALRCAADAQHREHVLHRGLGRKRAGTGRRLGAREHGEAARHLVNSPVDCAGIMTA
jgi:hypothetical protein